MASIETSNSALIIGSFAALLFLGLVFLLFSANLFKKKEEEAILLVGPCNSGKTATFLQLRDGLKKGQLHPTHTSMKENDDRFIFHEELSLPGKAPKPVRVIDLPGHHRLRPAVHAALPKAAGVLLMVDIQDYSQTPTPDELDHRQRRVQDAAELLYEIMTDTNYTNKKGASVLVLCNKQDLITDGEIDPSPTVPAIKARLTKELEQLRETRSSFMAQTDGKDSVKFLGVEGEKFSFENAPIDVDFVSSSAKKGVLGEAIRYIRAHT